MNAPLHDRSRIASSRVVALLGLGLLLLGAGPAASVGSVILSSPAAGSVVAGGGVTQTGATPPALPAPAEVPGPVEVPGPASGPGSTSSAASPTTESDRAASHAEARRLATAASILSGDVHREIPADAMAAAVRYHYEPDGRWHAFLDAAALTDAVAAAAEDFQPAADPGLLRDRGGNVVGVLSTTIERVDAAATAQRIADQAPAMRSGAISQIAVQVVVGPASVSASTTPDPAVAAAVAAGAPEMVLVGTWTTWYPPASSNGFGANITIPAKAIDGMVIPPGGLFEFWKAVGPVTGAQGYRMGGVIQDGLRLSRGALGGGICAAATTIFNAAARAGYDIVRRSNHTYYLSRYPLGLDATVYKDVTGRVATMSWRNDTDYPILIRTRAHPGVIRVDLYSVPTGRTVTFSDPVVTNLHKAADRIIYTSSLAAGQTKRLAEASDAMRVVVVRQVYQGDALVHEDRFVSQYARANGVLEVSSRR